MNKTFKYMGVVLGIVFIFLTIASYKYLTSDNELGPNLITAYVGVAVSAVVTLVLLSGQTKDEERKERNLKLYNAKLKVYSSFVSCWYKSYSDNQITPNELMDLRTILFGKVFFYVENKDLFEVVEGELSSIIEKNEKIDANDPKMTDFFTRLVTHLQNDLNGIPVKMKESALKTILKQIEYRFSKKNREIDVDDCQRNIWRFLEQIIVNTAEDGDFSFIKQEQRTGEVLLDPAKVEQKEPTNIINSSQDYDNVDDSESMKEQSWHFIMWSDEQLIRLKNGFKELSLIEYGEYWRTNLVKQVRKNDIVFLFRRGGYGYVGAYRAVGWRVFYFEEDREELQIFGKETPIITPEKYLSDIKEFDIYESKNDGATTCANIIVEPIAFVEDGVGYPGGVYRRTISRYDTHYAWQLRKMFEDKGEWKE